MPCREGAVCDEVPMDQINGGSILTLSKLNVLGSLSVFGIAKILETRVHMPHGRPTSRQSLHPGHLQGQEKVHFSPATAVKPPLDVV